MLLSLSLELMIIQQTTLFKLCTKDYKARVAVRAPEGLEELFHIQGWEGQW